MTDTTIKTLDLQRMWLATGLVCAFCASLLLLFLRGIPEANKDLVTYMVGQLSGMATMALSFYFINKAGQDAADAKKTENTGKMADAITAAAQAGTGLQEVVLTNGPTEPIPVEPTPTDGAGRP